MKYCTYCGKEIADEAVICTECGCAVNHISNENLLQQLSTKLHTNAIIWIVIDALQIICGIFINWFILIVGILNIISSVQDINYSKNILLTPNGIVKKFEPLTGAVIVLIYNLVIGGFIGVIGSIYYFIAVRGFVMQNRIQFENMEIH